MTTRRHTLQALGALAASAALPRAQAQAADDYPARAVTIVVPFAAGQSGDILARLLAEALGRQWGGKTFLIDNRGGAGGAVGSLAVVRAAADGYTLLMGSSGPIAIAPQVSKTAGYMPLKDLTPIINLAGVPQMMVVAANSHYKSLQDLIDAAKKAPGKLSYGTGGTGSLAHLTMELLKTRAGIDITHVPYKGASPAYTDLIAGRLDVMFDTTPAAIGFVRSGQLRFLAASTIKRTPIVPDVPTVSEAGVPGFDVLGWLGFLGPAGLPPAIVQKLNAGWNRSLQEPAIRARLENLGLAPIGGTPEEFRKFLEADYEKFGAVVRSAHISSE